METTQNNTHNTQNNTHNAENNTHNAENNTQNNTPINAQVKKRVRNTQTVKEYNKKYQMLKKQELNDLKKQIEELKIELAYYKNHSIE